MIVFTTIRIAVRALKRNKLRTLLTALGIIIGVGAVIAMVSIGNGAKSQIEAQIASLGQNVLNVMSGNFSRGGVRMGWGSAGTLTREDYDAIQKEIVGLSGLSPEVGANAQVATGNQNSFVSVKGVSADYVEVRSWGVVSGANFTDMRRPEREQGGPHWPDHCAEPVRRRRSRRPNRAHQERSFHHRRLAREEGLGNGRRPGRRHSRSVYQRHETAHGRRRPSSACSPRRPVPTNSPMCRIRSPNCSGNAIASATARTMISWFRPSRRSRIVSPPLPAS